MRIHVTAEDIFVGGQFRAVEQTARDRALHCPTALALNRLFDGTGSCVVKDAIRIGDEAFPRYAITPWRVRRFIKRFDAKKRVKPFTFSVWV
jgi:hypothetical protein